MLLYKQLKSRICHNRHSGNFAASVISCIRFSDLWHSVFVWNEYAVIISQSPFFYTKETASRFHMDMQIIDAGIIHGFETLIKICGYIILFSIFCEMLQTLPFPAHWFSLAATGFLEVTNGVALLSTSACTRQIKSLLAVLFLSWGGLSGIFQVSSILHQTGISLRNYVLQKIILLLLTVGCCIPLLFLGILI